MTTLTPLVPISGAVDLATVKARLGLTTTAGDGEIQRLIRAASALVEDHLRRTLITRSWRLVRDGWPEHRALCLPRPPLQTVDSVRWRDASGQWQTLPATSYAVETAPEPGFLLKTDGQPWPATDGRAGSVEVLFTAGYGPDPSAVPEPLAGAIIELVAAAHDEGGWRLPPITGQLAEMLAPYRVLQLA
ncbi:MAG: hypothetical protein D6740_13260 [Alphaproteobacteria bacterium]|nr:MAG: hypothetical protein D6740_13260 [Alphaproteobacteria bacterium]